MKKFLIALNIVIWSVVCVQLAHAEGETKKVCVDVMKDGKPVVDPKTKKTKQSCKEVKQHKKHEATAVPDGKKK